MSGAECILCYVALAAFGCWLFGRCASENDDETTHGAD